MATESSPSTSKRRRSAIFMFNATYLLCHTTSPWALALSLAFLPAPSLPTPGWEVGSPSDLTKSGWPLDWRTIADPLLKLAVRHGWWRTPQVPSPTIGEFHRIRFILMSLVDMREGQKMGIQSALAYGQEEDLFSQIANPFRLTTQSVAV